MVEKEDFGLKPLKIKLKNCSPPKERWALGLKPKVREELIATFRDDGEAIDDEDGI